MSDLLVKAEDAREPLQASFSDASNPIGLDGIEFIEFATPKPQALGQVLEMAGFKPVARHRSREVLLYRQGDLNVVVNGHPSDVKGAAHGAEGPAMIEGFRRRAIVDGEHAPGFPRRQPLGEIAAIGIVNFDALAKRMACEKSG